MRSRLVVAVAGAVCLALAAPAHADTVTHAAQTVDIACGTSVLHQPSDWYFPEGAPRALIWLQHGFARTDANVADLARRFAAAGYLVFTPALPFVDAQGCTLQNLTGNRAFLDNVADLFGTATEPGGVLNTNLAEAAARSGRADITMPARMIFVGHSAGAEAVTYVAERIRTAHPGAWPDLRGLILLDPVTSFLDNNTDPALTALDPTPLPVLAVSAAPSWCNTFGSGTESMRRHLHRPFLGVRLTGGSHTDAEGASTDTVATLLCGAPRAADVAELDTLALGWADDYLTGDLTGGFDPGAPAADVVAAPGVEILRPY